VLSGNRNFEARVHQSIKANFLMSPPLVVAYAIAGTVDIDLSKDELVAGSGVYLKDIWPTLKEVRDAMESALSPDVFRKLYTDFASQNPKWNEIQGSIGEVFEWDGKSTYIQHPPFFADFSMTPGDIVEIKGARPLGIFGDSVTTDHISPAGAIKKASPAGRFLTDNGVTQADFNSYGSRRGNDLVMTRGTFANVRIKNLMLGGKEGGDTLLQPAGTEMSIYDAAEAYKAAGTPSIILGGEDYGMGSSRDWAAKGTRLLGVKAVITKSFERIHRSNLVGMGVLPCNFKNKADYDKVKDLADATFDLLGLSNDFKPMSEATLRVHKSDGSTFDIPVIVRIDTPVEIDYYRAGGILPYVLAQILRANGVSRLSVQPSSPTEDAAKFNHAVNRPGGEESAEDFMRRMEPRLRKLRYRKLETESEPIVYAEIGSLPEFIPSSQLGQAFTRLLHIYCELMIDKSGLLLADEIENGVYFGNLQPFWGGILNLVEEQNSQIVATTHSFECMKAAHQAACERADKGGTYDLNIIRLDRVDWGIKATEFGRDTMEVAIANGWEMR
jgi:3-isopropylmalate dehydratase small subunit